MKIILDKYKFNVVFVSEHWILSDIILKCVSLVNYKYEEQANNGRNSALHTLNDLLLICASVVRN